MTLSTNLHTTRHVQLVPDSQDPEIPENRHCDCCNFIQQSRQYDQPAHTANSSKQLLNIWKDNGKKDKSPDVKQPTITAMFATPTSGTPKETPPAHPPETTTKTNKSNESHTKAKDGTEAKGSPPQVSGGWHNW
jgi:hypothetical protein